MTALVSLLFLATPATAPAHCGAAVPASPVPALAMAGAAEGSPTRSVSTAAAPEVNEDSPDPFEHAASGFYPIWDNNGYVLPHRRAVIGTSAALFGIGGVLQLGLVPTALAMRTPNLQAKLALYQSEQILVAAQVSTLVLLPGASATFASPRYTSRLDNPENSIVATPLSLAMTWRPTPWLAIHPSLTGLGVFGRNVKNEVFAGGFVTAELTAAKYHSFFLHAGEIGFWDHDMAILGASYRLNWGWLEARIGYVYRVTPDGLQGQPLMSAGLLL
ncbi:MAG: hypothetical protein HY903_22790 [Deltaproteobacteria bacterium]|nr:hypothetical protein [Deltaproteobacteria bacterium]